MNQREPIAFRFRNSCTNPNLQVKTMGIVLKWLTEGANRNPSVPSCFLCRESSESQVCKAEWLKEENTIVLPLFHDERQKRRNQKRNRRYPGQRRKRTKLLDTRDRGALISGLKEALPAASPQGATLGG